MRGQNHPRGAGTAPASKGQREDKRHWGLEFLTLPGQKVPSCPWLRVTGMLCAQVRRVCPSWDKSPSVMTLCCGISSPTRAWQMLFKSLLLIFFNPPLLLYNKLGVEPGLGYTSCSEKWGTQTVSPFPNASGRAVPMNSTIFCGEKDFPATFGSVSFLKNHLGKPLIAWHLCPRSPLIMFIFASEITPGIPRLI